MRRKNHPVLCLLAMVILVGFLWMNGAFELANVHDDESAETTEEKVEVAAAGEDTSATSASEATTEHTHEAYDVQKENEKDPTCTKKGSYEEVTYCACGYEMEREKKTVKAKGHKFHEGFCKVCQAEDPDYIKVYTSAELYDVLKTSIVNMSDGIDFVDAPETVSVFAEEFENGISVSAAPWYNLFSNNIREMVFNMRKLNRMIPELTLMIGGETGSSGGVDVDIYMNGSEEPDYSYYIDCSDAPTEVTIDIKDAESMRVVITNESSDFNTIVLYEFAGSGKPVRTNDSEKSV